MARSNIFKLKESKFRLDISKAFFMMRVVKHWNRISKEGIIFPFMEPLMVMFDRTLSNLMLPKISLLIVGGWIRCALKVLFNPNHFRIL